ALLRRLAELTGGRVYEERDDALAALARSGELFRDAPQTVRSLLPVWFWLVFAAGMLLIPDVGVRRVSVDPNEVRGWAVRVWSRLRRRAAAVTTSGEEMSR